MGVQINEAVLTPSRCSERCSDAWFKGISFGGTEPHTITRWRWLYLIGAEVNIRANQYQTMTYALCFIRLNHGNQERLPARQEGKRNEHAWRAARGARLKDFSL